MPRVGDGPWQRSSRARELWKLVKELGVCVARGHRHTLWGVCEGLDSGEGQMRNLVSMLTEFSGAHMEGYERFHSHGLLPILFSAKAGLKTLFNISRWHPPPETGMVGTWHEPTEIAQGLRHLSVGE